LRPARFDSGCTTSSRTEPPARLAPPPPAAPPGARRGTAPHGAISRRTLINPITQIGLEVGDGDLFVSAVTRLAEQKGFDLLAEIVPAFPDLGVELVLLGSGEARTERRFELLEQWFADWAPTSSGRISRSTAARSPPRSRSGRDSGASPSASPRLGHPDADDRRRPRQERPDEIEPLIGGDDRCATALDRVRQDLADFEQIAGAGDALSLAFSCALNGNEEIPLTQRAALGDRDVLTHTADRLWRSRSR
jgi:hypothetical protein